MQRHRIGPGKGEEDRGHDQQNTGIDLGGRLPAEGDNEEGCPEIGHRRTHIADTENAQRRALVLGLIPSRDIGNADDEGATCETNAERSEQEHRIGRRPGQKEGGNRRCDHLDREDQPPAIFLGQNTKEEAADGSGQHRGCDQQAELGFGQTQFLFDPDADDREDRPHGKTHREGQRAHAECLTLLACCDAVERAHPVPQ